MNANRRAELQAPAPASTKFVAAAAGGGGTLTAVKLCGRCPHPRINPFSGTVDVPRLAVLLHNMGRTAIAMREKIRSSRDASILSPLKHQLLFFSGRKGQLELAVAKANEHVIENWIEVKKNERKTFAGVCMDCRDIQQLKVGDKLVVEKDLLSSSASD